MSQMRMLKTAQIRHFWNRYSRKLAPILQKGVSKNTEPLLGLDQISLSLAGRQKTFLYDLNEVYINLTEGAI